MAFLEDGFVTVQHNEETPPAAPTCGTPGRR
jgi:hypothetical protein